MANNSWVFKQRRAISRGVLEFALLALLVSGCNRWRPNTPVEVSVAAQPAFARVLEVLRTQGYAVAEQDSSSGYIRITAKTASSAAVGRTWAAVPASWFGVQIQPGKVVLRAAGELVEDNDTVRRNSLDEEMQTLAAALQAQLQQ